MNPAPDEHGHRDAGDDRIDIDKDLIHERAAELTARLFPERVAPPGDRRTQAR